MADQSVLVEKKKRDAPSGKKAKKCCPYAGPGELFADVWSNIWETDCDSEEIGLVRNLSRAIKVLAVLFMVCPIRSHRCRMIFFVLFCFAE
jgi:hypothetical protein